ITLITLLALAASPALPETQAEVLAADLMAGWRSGPGSHMTALHLRLAPEWKTYWRSPGEAGIPPEFDWSGSQNVGAVRLYWPRPEVFAVSGMQSIGYHHELVLPIEITAIDPAQPIHLRVRVALGVCRDICMPASLDLAADLPAPASAGAATPDPVIRSALRAQPDSARAAGLRTISCQVDPIADGLRLTATLQLPSTGGDETVVLEPGQTAIWVSDAQSDRAGDRLVASADLVADSGTAFALDRSAVTVTVLGRDRAVEITGCPAP
ncbi:MAG: protein-disulfide reductase DsbD family protein, partial [Pseudorhodobacter sp.]|nr:protein-disulfide reductase DsbD family protein [Pseudorhodobacter sp.]